LLLLDSATKLPALVQLPDQQITESAARARQIIMEVERGLGFEPIDGGRETGPEALMGNKLT
jgi:hypothetical protein